MLVDKIIKNGWYRKSQTLGEGGWNLVRSGLGICSRYDLTAGSEENFEHIETIYAANDEAAVKGFNSLYNLEQFDFWDIHEVICEYRLVDTNDKGECSPLAASCRKDFMSTIKLPDGYNGHFVECEREPIEKDGDNYKLRVKGSYLIRWCTRQQWEEASNVR